MLDVWVTLAGIAALGAVTLAVIWRFRPDPEIVGVDVLPGEWASFTIRLPRRRGYRVWARVSTAGERHEDVAAEVEVKTAAAILHPSAPLEVSAARWHDSASSFAVRLCTLPELDAGTIVTVRGKLTGTGGTALHSARIYVGG